MPGEVFLLPFRPGLDANAIPIVGARLEFYASETSTPQAVFSNEALTASLGAVVEANSAGVWPTIYLDKAKTYRVVMRSPDGEVLREADPYVLGATDTLAPDVAANAALAARSAGEAEGFSLMLALTSGGYVNRNDSRPPVGTPMGDGYLFTLNGGFFLGFNDNGQAADIVEFATAASQLQGVRAAIDWVDAGTAPVTGDSGFSRSPWFTSWTSGRSNDVRYIGYNRTGTILPGPGNADRGYSGAVLHVDARYDDADIGDDFGRVGMFRNVLTGPFRGGRIGVVGEINQQAIAGPTQNNRNYVGVQGNAITHTGDGGTADVPRGGYFGAGFSAYLYADAQYVLTNCGIEVNNFTEAGSSTRYNIAVSATGANVVRGSVVDAAFDVGGQNDANGLSHAGWNHGLIFSDHHGADPVHSGSILIGYHWNNGPARPVLHGVDLSGFVVSGALIQGQRTVLTEDRLTLGANTSNVSEVQAGNGSTDANLLLRAKGSGGAQLVGGDGVPRFIADVTYGVRFLPTTNPTPPANNGEVLMEKTSDTLLTFRMRGDDGVVRSGSITLS